ncbi:MAG: hypothetical protein R3A80_03820 [Bdellovibrionota bacterium]
MTAGGPRSFLRILDKGSKSWLEETPEALAKRFLCSEQEECSVYLVQSVQDEVEVAAAHFATFGKSSVDRIHGLRISEDQITDAGLSVNSTPGSTGFKYIDQRHFDIVGITESFNKLAELLVFELNKGEDLMRYIEPPLIKKFLIQFLVSHVADMEKPYQEKALKCLKLPTLPTSIAP